MDKSASYVPPAQFANVTALTKANLYFDGKVASHVIVLANGEKKTLGLIYPGAYHFGTDAAERMEIIAGSCKVVLDGAPAAQAKAYGAGQFFDVPAKSGYAIEVAAASGVCEYVCSYLA